MQTRCMEISEVGTVSILYMLIHYPCIQLSAKCRISTFLLFVTLFSLSVNTSPVPHQTGIDIGTWRIIRHICTHFQTCPDIWGTISLTPVEHSQHWQWWKVSGRLSKVCSGASQGKGPRDRWRKRTGEGVASFPLVGPAAFHELRDNQHGRGKWWFSITFEHFYHYLSITITNTFYHPAHRTLVKIQVHKEFHLKFLEILKIHSWNVCWVWFPGN